MFGNNRNLNQFQYPIVSVKKEPIEQFNPTSSKFCFQTAGGQYVPPASPNTLSQIQQKTCLDNRPPIYLGSPSKQQQQQNSKQSNGQNRTRAGRTVSKGFADSSKKSARSDPNYFFKFDPNVRNAQPPMVQKSITDFFEVRSPAGGGNRWPPAVFQQQSVKQQATEPNRFGSGHAIADYLNSHGFVETLEVFKREAQMPTPPPIDLDKGHMDRFFLRSAAGGDFGLSPPYNSSFNYSFTRTGQRVHPYLKPIRRIRHPRL